MDESVRQLGRDIAESLHLPQLVDWLSRKLTVRPAAVYAGAGLLIGALYAFLAASLGYAWPVVILAAVVGFVATFFGCRYFRRDPN